MGMLPTPPPEISVHSFSDGGVLFLRGSRRIWVLNATAVYIWCLLDEVSRLSELADRVSSTFHIDKSKAIQDVSATITLFEHEGLFNTKIYDETIENAWDITPIGPRIIEPHNWAVKRFFRVANHLFEFCCQDTTIGDIFSDLIEHVAVKSNSEPDTRLAVISDTREVKQFDLFYNDLGFSLGLADDEVLPQLFTLLFVRSCESLKNRLLFHAAVIEMGGITVMFPGEAGSGKTTLVAALLSCGCRFYSDELAVINVDNLQVSPLPLPMSIKPGSVKPLEGYYPGLFDRQIYLRSDGKKVRYISPSAQDLPSANSSAKIDFLIFPKYIEDEGNRMVRIDKTSALQRLALTGSSNRTFSSKDIEAMIALIDKRPCYEIVYSNLPQAVSQLKNNIFMC